MENREIGLTLLGCKPSLVLSVFSSRLVDIIGGTTTTAITPSLECPTEVDGSATTVRESRDVHISTPCTTGLTCSTCRIKFENVNNQREHFKLDWHRFNVKLLLEGKNILDEEEFEDQISDISSISGSDPDSDSDEHSRSSSPPASGGGKNPDDDKDIVMPKRPEFHNKIYYFDGVRSAYAMYKCMVKGRDEGQPGSFASAVDALRVNGCIIIAMMSGGHFAAAIFHNDEIVEHKTFHRYTIRAKRGTTQSVHDNSKFARSAGASIRRHNEAALSEDIKNLFVGWSDHVHHATLIFYKCPAHSKTVLFGSERPFGKGDNRIRKIPFITRRPTLKEVQRVFSELSSVHCFDYLPDHSHPCAIPHKSADSYCHTGKKEVPEKDNLGYECPKQMFLGAVQLKDSQRAGGTENDSNLVLGNSLMKKTSGKASRNVEVNPKSCTDLSIEEESNGDEKGDHSILSKENKGKESDRKMMEAQDNTTNGSFPFPMYNRALGLCEKGDLNGLQKLLDKLKCSSIDSCGYCSVGQGVSTQNDPSVIEPLSCTSCQFCKFLNHHEENGRTLLHKAALCGHCDLVWFLMKYGADPSNRDDRGKTPYAVAETKDVRNTFRRFMAEFPSRYDYRAAQIPTPLTTAMEEERARKNNEKKKAQRKTRKAREKVSKAAEVDGSIKNTPCSSANTLTDREKRAIAAERRFGTQLTENSRCANCGCQVEAKTAFRRYDFLYCTTQCVHEHRQKIGK